MTSMLLYELWGSFILNEILTAIDWDLFLQHSHADYCAFTHKAEIHGKQRLASILEN